MIVDKYHENKKIEKESIFHSRNFTKTLKDFLDTDKKA